MLIPFSLWGQAGMYGEEGKTFSAALICGTNFAQVDGDSYYGYHKLGLNAGAAVFAHFTTEFGVSLELLYSQKGSRGVTETTSPYIGPYFSKYYMDLNYVEIPLLLHLTSRIVDIEAGASFAYLIKSDEWILTDQPVPISPIYNSFNTTDIDLTFGLTRQLYKKLLVNIRYQYSLISVRPPEKIPYGYRYGNDGQFNNLFNLRLMYVL